MEKLIINNNLAEIKKVSELLEMLKTKWHLDEEVVYDLNLVFDELLSNIVFYAYEDKEVHDILITFSNHVKGVLIAQVIDDGVPFNPVEYKSERKSIKSIEDIEPGNLGIHFIKSLVENISYERKNNQNILNLNKSYKFKNK